MQRLVGLLQGEELGFMACGSSIRGGVFVRPDFNPGAECTIFEVDSFFFLSVSMVLFSSCFALVSNVVSAASWVKVPLRRGRLLLKR